MSRPDPETLRRRRECKALLDELQAAGLITYWLIPPDLDGPEPHLEVRARRSDTFLATPDGLSEAAQAIWEDLRHRRAVPWSGLLRRKQQ